MSNEKPLLITRNGAVMSISINDAPINRMSFAYIDALEAAVEEAATDSSVRALLFTGEGETSFSVGMDLKEAMREVPARGGWDSVLDQRLRVLARIESLGKPSVATMFGYCLGGGLELPLACHFRLAADTGTQIGLPEMDLGTVPAWGGSVRLTRCIGRDNALDMVLRARRIDGHEALRMGLVRSIHPVAELKTAAMALAQELAEKAPLAVDGVLRCIVGADERTLHEGLREERQAFLHCAASNDQAEGARAFFEKRKPVFRGN
ncbi:enoyl-CoA hydratase/isomerase family protein [Pseudomonas sp. NPDC086251]|uniref:enoyl-CoA hydratase/isomerase family protein n=1 Tax=Pseudomonas sp. NPDC086251 TaxID=3364431 RepID=UPI003834F5A1